MLLNRVLACLLLCMSVVSADFGMATEKSFFQIYQLTDIDKKKIVEILKPLESKWVSADERTNTPGLYWQEDLQKQSFRILSTQKGLENVYFVSIQADFQGKNPGDNERRLWSTCASFLIINRESGAIRVLPDHPFMNGYLFDEVQMIAFRDVQGTGDRSIIIDVSAITGIGPTGTVPFEIYAIYLPNPDGSWRLDEKLQKRVDEQLYDKCNREDCRTLDAVLKVSKKYFKKSK